MQAQSAPEEKKKKGQQDGHRNKSTIKSYSSHKQTHYSTLFDVFHITSNTKR